MSEPGKTQVAPSNLMLRNHVELPQRIICFLGFVDSCFMLFYQSVLHWACDPGKAGQLKRCSNRMEYQYQYFQQCLARVRTCLIKDIAETCLFLQALLWQCGKKSVQPNIQPVCIEA